MNSTRLALTFSLLTVAAWTAKAVAIGVSGGLGRSSLEGPLFFVGLACLLVAAASTGIAIAGRGPRRRRALGGLLGVVATALFGVLAVAVLAGIEPRSPGWAWEEANLWATMLALLAVAATVGVREGPRHRLRRP